MNNAPAMTTMFAPFLCINIIQGFEPLILENIPLGDPINSTTIVRQPSSIYAPNYNLLSKFLAIGTILILVRLLTPKDSPDTTLKPIRSVTQLFSISDAGTVALLALALFSARPILRNTRHFPISSSDGNFHLLASANSRQGLVVVGENAKDGYRQVSDTNLRTLVIDERCIQVSSCRSFVDRRRVDQR